MRILLIDIGNTTCDARAYDPSDQSITPLFRIFSRKLLINAPALLQEHVGALNETFSKIIYVSVVPELNDLVRDLGRSLSIEVINIRNDIAFDQSPFKLKNIHLLGADFVANFFGFMAHYPCRNVAIVALGSATTIFLIQEGNFVGTTISPGVTFSLEALLSNASLLEQMDYQMIPETLGKNTFESISIGSIKGHYHMIMGLIGEMKEEYRIDKILFTGGNARFYEERCEKEGVLIDEELIFKGLINLYEAKGRLPAPPKKPQLNETQITE